MGSAASTVETDASANGAVATLLVCHSSQETKLRKLIASYQVGEQQEQKDQDHVVAIVTESFPRDLQTRAEVLLACESAIVGVDPLFQTSSALIDTLSFLKDTRKQITAGPLTFFTRPSGAVGAICTAFAQWEPRLFEDASQSRAVSSKTKLLTHSDLQEILERSASSAEIAEIEESDQQILDQAASTGTAPLHMLFVHADDDGNRIAQQFVNMESQGTTLAASSSLSTQDVDKDLAALAGSAVVAFIITSGSVANTSYRRLFEAALRWKRPLLPINAGVRLSGWLQLAMAGRLWYQVDLDHLDYLHLPYSQVPNCPCKVVDSCLATDFLVCANGLLTSAAAAQSARVLDAALLSSREQAALQVATDKALVAGLAPQQVDTLVTIVQALVDSTRDSPSPSSSTLTALEKLGVATTTDAIETQRAQSALPYPSVTELLPELTELKLANIHYTMTRMEFKPPPSVLDANGLPITNLQLDAMFSYQWGSQETVLDVHQQGDVFNVRSWFDVFGHMQGNVNSAMATAVENVACVVVFLTQKYVESINCQLEFQYAARCKKPFLIVCLSDINKMTLPTWMTEVIGKDFPVYPLSAEADAAASGGSSTQPQVLALDYHAERVNGVPLRNVLFGAIRVLAAQRNKAPLAVAYDGSLLLYAVTSALRHVAHAPATTVSGGASTASVAAPPLPKITCTRCSAAFNPSVPSSLDGCRKHSAYYVGGSIIAGRWVCCSETKKDGPGCQTAQHIQTERKWTCDPAYGTYSWKPQ